MTYRTICERLTRAGIESAEWDAQLLLEQFCPSVAMRAVLDSTLEFESTEALEEAIGRRECRYPLQYILGEWQFYRQTYEVTPDCLIPRADTEILVEEAIKRLPKNARFADLCTGSGCIAISVLAERPDTTAIAVDKFEDTLKLAVRNAQRNGVADRMQALCRDVLADRFLKGQEGAFDAILSNPPYIPTAVVDTLDAEVHAEPRAALDGGNDGLIFYRTMVEHAATYLKPDGFFLFEIGFDQADALRQIGAQYGFFGYRMLRDYGGNDRVVCLWRECRIN